MAFTQPATSRSGALVYNYLNKYIDQGASYTFVFTPSKSYSREHTLRFVFPEGFKSKEIKCSVSNIVDPTMKTHHTCTTTPRLIQTRSTRRVNLTH